jgi:tetratricopeptide (TPR) repeat protein
MKPGCAWIFASALCSPFAVAAEAYPCLPAEVVGPINPADDLPNTEVAVSAAIASWRQMIDGITDSEGGYSVALVDPLIALSHCYQLASDWTGAEESLRLAQHLIHRHEGVRTLRQLEVIDRLTQIYVASGKSIEADREQQLALYVSQQNVGHDPSALVPAMLKLSRWYVDSGQFVRARKTVDDTIEMIERNAGKQDPLLIQPLLQSAKIKRLLRSPSTYDEVEAAQEIVDAHSEVDADTRAEVFLALGEAYTAASQYDRATAAYGEAWKLRGAGLAGDLFAAPSPIAMAKALSTEYQSRIDLYRAGRSGPSFPFSERALSTRDKVGEDERLWMDVLPPQQFLVRPDDPQHGHPDAGGTWYLPDAYALDPDREPIRLIGHPYQFLVSQLQRILPPRLQKPLDLAQLRIDLDMTVTAEGKVQDVEVTTADVPGSLAKLMRKTLLEARFRPRLIDGTPVPTEHFRLVQAFDR